MSPSTSVGSARGVGNGRATLQCAGVPAAGRLAHCGTTPAVLVCRAQSDGALSSRRRRSRQGTSAQSFEITQTQNVNESNAAPIMSAGAPGSDLNAVKMASLGDVLDLTTPR